jgi:hypothetical protein
MVFIFHFCSDLYFVLQSHTQKQFLCKAVKKPLFFLSALKKVPSIFI